MENFEYRKGMVLAICAYVLWGVAPLYFKLLQTIPATEIMLHRVIWSFVFILLLMFCVTGFKNVRSLLKRPHQIAMLCVTSLLIACNWLLFIWAVNNDHMLDASLGYYINPLLNVVLGMLFLGERLQKMQWLAVGLAATGVLIQLISFGSIPVVSITLATSFGLYALLRKKINIDAQTGLLLETALMMPLVLGYMLLMPQNLSQTASASMFTNTWDINLLLIAAGIVTSVPLLCFAGAAVRIPLTILGFFQYIGPSIMFILAVAMFNEPFDLEKSITFGFIWLALLVFTMDMANQGRKERKATKALPT